MRGMLRYFVIAGALVVFVLAVIATWWLRQPHGIGVTSVPTTMAPRPEPGHDAIGQSRGGFLANAEWALSALPGCLMQVSITRGSRAYVRAAVPADATEVAPPATLQYRDCRISLTATGAIVHRGPDTLRLPPPLRVFRSATHLYVMHSEGVGAQLRAYVLSNM